MGLRAGGATTKYMKLANDLLLFLAVLVQRAVKKARHRAAVCGNCADAADQGDLFESPPELACQSAGG
jgi:hypothetical protein